MFENLNDFKFYESPSMLLLSGAQREATVVDS
jgi:hypothetical protein